MPVCGERFYHLIRNGLGGTRESPCELYCNVPDADAWLAAARDLRNRIRKEYWRLWEARNKAGGAIDAALVQEAAAYDAAVDELPAEATVFSLPTTWTELTASAIATMERGCCVLERVDDALRAAGTRGVDVPAPTPEGKGILGGLGDALSGVGGILLIVGIGYLALREGGDG